jgi:pilus assembly protein CpaE
MDLLWDTDPLAGERYSLALGAVPLVLDSAPVVGRALHDNPAVTLVVIGPDVELDAACDLAEAMRVERPAVGVLLLRHRVDVTTLSQALRSGIREVVAAEDQPALAEAVRHSRELTARLSGGVAGGGPRGHVVTVFSAKGGVGKTTLATNLAVQLTGAGARTLLVDLDLSFGDVAISLQLLPVSTIADALTMSGHVDSQGLASLVTKHDASGLHVLCAPSDPSDADRIPATLVGELLKVAAMDYDYVVVDTPPSFTEHVLTACDVSDALVLIATLDIPAVKNLRIALDTLDELGNPDDSRIIVLNRSDTKVGLRAEDVVTAIKRPIAVSVPNSLTVPATVNKGVPIVLDEPRHPVSLAVAELADVHVRGRFGDVTAESDGRRRGFGLRRGR